jgi:hypothetical protein
MQWKPKPFVPIPNGVWHPYFAWLPTDCEDGTVVWLGWCERKFEYYREHETYYRTMKPRAGGVE